MIIHPIRSNFYSKFIPTARSFGTSRNFRESRLSFLSKPLPFFLSAFTVGAATGYCIHRFGDKSVSQIKSDCSNSLKKLSTKISKTLLRRDNFYVSKIPDKDLYSIGGYEEAIHQLADIVHYLQDPEEFCESGAKPPKGVIISGPPGVGKTELVKALAGHARVPLFLVSGAELRSSTIGDTEANIRDLFSNAEGRAPCIVLIDEIDSIGSHRLNLNQVHSRNSTYGAVFNSEVNQLLTSISQCPENVIVIGTTNHREWLDEALIRPGRLERHIHLGFPNHEDRRQILDIHSKEKKIGSDVNKEHLVAISAGFSGAKIQTWINEAAILATKNQSKTVDMIHFDQAMMLLENGILQKPHQDRKIKTFVAAHEAGHALVGSLLKKEIFKVSVLPQGSSQGHTYWISEENPITTKEKLLNEICITLAGRAAEEIFETAATGCESDIQHAKEIAKMMIMNEAMGQSITGKEAEIESVLQEQMKRAKKIIYQNHDTWHRLIDALVEHDILFQRDIEEILSGKSSKELAPREITFSSKGNIPEKASKRSSILWR